MWYILLSECVMDYRTFWHQFQLSAPPQWTVMWFCTFLHLAAIGSLTGLFSQPFFSGQRTLLYTQPVIHGAQAFAALPCTSQTQAYYTRQQLLAIRPAPLDRSLIPHLRSLGIGYHLASRRSTRGGKNKRRKIPVVISSHHRHFSHGRHENTTDGGVAPRRP